MTTRPDLAALMLAALVVVAITVLAALHVAIPDVLALVAAAAVGTGGGVAIPRGAVVAPTAAPAAGGAR